MSSFRAFHNWIGADILRFDDKRYAMSFSLMFVVLVVLTQPSYPRLQNR